MMRKRVLAFLASFILTCSCLMGSFPSLAAGEGLGKTYGNERVRNGGYNNLPLYESVTPVEVLKNEKISNGDFENFSVSRVELAVDAPTAGGAMGYGSTNANNLAAVVAGEITYIDIVSSGSNIGGYYKEVEISTAGKYRIVLDFKFSVVHDISTQLTISLGGAGATPIISDELVSKESSWQTAAGWHTYTADISLTGEQITQIDRYKVEITGKAVTVSIKNVSIKSVLDAQVGNDIVATGNFTGFRDYYVLRDYATNGFGTIVPCAAGIVMNDPADNANTVLKLGSSQNGQPFSSFFKLLALENATEYAVSIDFKLNEGYIAQQFKGFKYWFAGGTGDSAKKDILADQANWTDLGDGWYRSTMNVTPVTGNDSLYVDFDTWNNGYVYIDNVSVKKTVMGSLEIATDGDFTKFLENTDSYVFPADPTHSSGLAIDNWGSIAFDSPAQVVNDGNNDVMKLTPHIADKFYSSTFRLLSLTAGRKYRVSLDFKVSEGYGDKSDRDFGLRFAGGRDSATGVMYSTVPAFAPSEDTARFKNVEGREGWKSVSFDIATVDGNNSLSIFFKGATTAEFALVDNVTVQLIAPEVLGDNIVTNSQLIGMVSSQYELPTEALGTGAAAMWKRGVGSAVVKTDTTNAANSVLVLSGDVASTGAASAIRLLEELGEGTYKIALELRYVDASGNAAIPKDIKVKIYCGADVATEINLTESKEEWTVSGDYFIAIATFTVGANATVDSFEMWADTTDSCSAIFDEVSIKEVVTEYEYNNQVTVIPKYDLSILDSTYEGLLSEGETEKILAGTQAEAIGGLWGNGVWNDSHAKLVKDGENTLLKVGFIPGKGGFAHFVNDVQFQGAGAYKLNFYFKINGVTDNCNIAINNSNFTDDGAIADVRNNIFSKPIADKPDWRRFEYVFTIKENSTMNRVRMWFNTALNVNNYILVDNMTISKETGKQLSNGGFYEFEDVVTGRAGMYSFATDSAASIVMDGENAVAKLQKSNGGSYSSVHKTFKYDKAGIYRMSFDFKPTGQSDNIGFRISPSPANGNEYPMLLYKDQWKEIVGRDGWYSFTLYLTMNDSRVYEDASVQMWYNCYNLDTQLADGYMLLDNLSIRRILTPVSGEAAATYGAECINDSGFENVLDGATSYLLPRGGDGGYDARYAISGVNAKVVTYEADYEAFKYFVAELSGNAMITNKVQLQDVGTYKLSIDYKLPANYNAVDCFTALIGTKIIDILGTAGTAVTETGWSNFATELKLTAAEAQLISDITIEFKGASVEKALIDNVSLVKEVGSDVETDTPDEPGGEDLVKYSLVKNGDFEGYSENLVLSKPTDELWGTVELDVPAQVVTLDGSKVLKLQHDPSSNKDFASAFNLYSAVEELERGRTYKISFDYKYTLADDKNTMVKVSDGRSFSIDEAFTFAFVGGSNIGHHEIRLASVGDKTEGANSQKCDITKTDKGNGWTNLSFRFTANSGLSVACNSMRFLFMTNKNIENIAYFDNVEFYTMVENGEQPGPKPDPGPTPDPKPDPTPGNPDDNTTLIVVLSIIGGVLVLGGAAFCVYWFVIRKKKRS